VASIGRIDYKLQKEKDRGTNEQSIADFSQSAHLEKSRQRSRNRRKKEFQKEPRTKRVFERSKRGCQWSFHLLRSQSLTACAALFRLFLRSRFRDSLLRPAQLRISDNGPRMTAEILAPTAVSDLDLEAGIYDLLGISDFRR